VKGELKENAEFDARMSKYEFNFAFDVLWSEIQNLNKRIDEEKPWALAKTDPEKAKAVLKSLIQDLSDINTRLAIFLPETAEKIAEIFEAEQITPPATPLFPKTFAA
jgi:methionyl-tRNA synthetase